MWTVWGSVFAVGSGWGVPARLDSVAHAADRPDIAVDGAGNAFAVWEQNDGLGSSRRNIWTNRYVNGTGWTGPQLLENLDGVGADTRSAGSVRVAASSTGAARAIWMQEESSGNVQSIWDAVHTPGAGWGAPALAESLATSAGPPTVAMDALGNSIES